MKQTNYAVVNKRQNKYSPSTHMAMTATETKGNWNILKGKLKQKWANLTDDDLVNLEGKADELVGRIQKRTGESQEAIRRYLKKECGTDCNCI